MSLKSPEHSRGVPRPPKDKKSFSGRLLDLAKDHPDMAAVLMKLLIDSTPENIPEKYIDEIVEAINDGRPIILISPHWSVVDVIGFLKVLFKVQKHKLIKNPNIRVVGPASSKFFSPGDTDESLRMKEGLLLDVLKILGLELMQVVQAQDEQLRSNLPKSKVKEINETTWSKLYNALINGEIFAVFPAGTRGDGPGASRADQLICRVLQIKIKQAGREVGKPALIVALGTIGSSEFLGKNSKNLAKWPRVDMGKPISLHEAQVLGKALNCHALEVPIVMITASMKEQDWGEYSEQIKKYWSIIKSYGSLEAFVNIIDDMVETRDTSS